MGCINSTNRPPEMYLDPSGILVKYDASSIKTRIGSEELSFVSSKDSNKVLGGEEFYLINIKWLSDWMNFAKGNIAVFNDKIDNSSLVDSSNEFKLRATARFKKEYRVIERVICTYYFESYGGGPALVFYCKSLYANNCVFFFFFIIKHSDVFLSFLMQLTFFKYFHSSSGILHPIL